MNTGNHEPSSAVAADGFGVELWVKTGELRRFARDYYVVFRFKAGCETPRSVDGKLAWTTRDLEISHDGKFIRVKYKTKEGRRIIDAFVPVGSLDVCLPIIGKERALVIDDDGKTDMLYPTHLARTTKGSATTVVGVYCTENRRGKRSDAKLFNVGSVTRARPVQLGEPGA